MARQDTKVSKIHAGTEIPGFKTPFTGKGVIVAAIDGGLDFTHVAFYDANRSSLRLERAWAHDDDSGNAPAKFGYGTEYKTQNALLEKKSDLVYYSHGSHVMNIAAGNNISCPYHGIAYDATLAFSTFSEIDKGISDAIQYLFDYADEKQMPAVINMSLGTEMGPHDGSSLRDVLGDELTGPGRILVGASGNNGLIDMHISKRFTEENTQLLTGVAFREGMSGIGELQVWGEPGKTLKVNVCTIDKETMAPVYKSRTYDCSRSNTASVTLQKPFDGSGGYFKIITQTSPLNGKPMAHITLGITDYQPDKVIAIMVTGEAGSTVHAWANENMCCFKKFLDNMDIPDHDYGICEIGGTGKSIITVASYNTKNNIPVVKGDPQVTEFTISDISPFSNVGPSADGRLKPDVAAPGSLIVSAFNSGMNNDPAIAYRESWNGTEYPYGVYQGTSMASPHVAGVIALWLQACPTLTPAQVRQTFDNTCRHDEFTGQGDNYTWGRGKIDAYEGLKYVLQNFAQSDIVSATVKDSPWSVNIMDDKLHVLYYKDGNPTNINVYTTSGMTVKGFSGGSRSMGNEDVINLSELPSGLYIINVTDGYNTETLKFAKH